MKSSFLFVLLLLCSLLVLGAVAQFEEDEMDLDEHAHEHGHAHDHDHGHAHDQGHSHSSAPPPDPNAKYTAPQPKSALFFEPFDEKWSSRWKLISTSKYNGKFSVEVPSKNAGIQGDKGLVVPEKARHYAAVAKFPSVIDPTGKDLVIQYEVRLQEGLDCGGAYLKILTAETMGSLDSFSNETPYTIMFGPDKCGSTSKVHFIFRHQNPVSKEFEEKHMKNPPAIKNDKLSHLYTLHVRPDNTFTVYVDQESVVAGSLLEDFEPSVIPPKEIDDPTDKKPADWVDEATIPDPSATKPADWDEDAPASIPDPDATKPEGWLDNEPTQIPDPTARKPSDWSDADDGEWIAPLVANPRCEEIGCGKWERPTIPNPNYKGKWTPPMISNPKYKGVWQPRKIANPNYFEDHQPSKFRPMGAVGIEIWTMSEGILFDNILITNDKSSADQYGKATWAVKYAQEKLHDVPDTPTTPEDKQTFMEKAEALLNNLRERLQDPYVFYATLAAGVLPLLLLLLWPNKTPAAPAAAAAATSNNATEAKPAAAPAETKKEEKKEGGKKGRKKSEQ